MSSRTKNKPVHPDTASRDPMPEPAVAPPPRRRSFTIEWRNPETELVDYIGAIWARRWMVLTVTGILGIAGFLWALRKPNVYASRAMMIVHGAAPTSAAEAAAGLLGERQILPSQVMNAVGVIQSRVVTGAVVQKLNPREILRTYKPVRNPNKETLSDEFVDVVHRLQLSWGSGGLDFSKFSEDVLVDHAIDVLQRHLEVSPAVRGSTIGLTYRGVSPNHAKRILDTLLEQAISHYNELMAPQEGQKWPETKVASAEQEETAANTAIDEFRKKHGMLDFAEDIEMASKSLAALRDELEMSKMRRDQATKVLGRYKEEIQGLEETKRMVVQEVEQPDGVETEIQTELIKARADLDELEAKDPEGRNKEERAALEARVKSLRDSLGENGGPPKLKTTALQRNPRYDNLDMKIAKAKSELLEFEVSIPNMEATLERGRKDLIELRRLHSEARKLRERLVTAEEKAEKLMTQKDAFETNQELNARGLTNLRVVEPASFPRQKESPSRGKLILAAVLGGFLLAVTWILVRTRMSRAILRPSHAAFALGRSDVVSFPLLQSAHVTRFDEARRRGFE